MTQAAAVYHAENAREARQRLAQWGKQWREQTPQSVATLERDFEQTLVFYSLSGLAPEWIRTTSLLERTNRELRRKFRQAVTFGSHKGVEVAIYLQVQRLDGGKLVRDLSCSLLCSLESPPLARDTLSYYSPLATDYVTLSL